jgi:hypothetical protein
MTNSNTAKRKPVAMNGVDTPALLATINAVGVQPELAKFWRMSAFDQSGHHRVCWPDLLQPVGLSQSSKSNSLSGHSQRACKTPTSTCGWKPLRIRVVLQARAN